MGFRATWAATAIIAAVGASAQPKDAPKFEDYPVAEIFHGAPAAPLLITPETRRYRTRILNGVSKGEGAFVDGAGEERPGVNFAGHYIVVQWACGSPCNMMAIVDARSGRVFKPPASDSLALSPLGGGPWLPTVEFRQNSTLMVLTPCPNSGPVFVHYFVWQNEQWKLVRRVRATENR